MMPRMYLASSLEDSDEFVRPRCSLGIITTLIVLYVAGYFLMSSDLRESVSDKIQTDVEQTR